MWRHLVYKDIAMDTNIATPLYFVLALLLRRYNSNEKQSDLEAQVYFFVMKRPYNGLDSHN